MTALKFFTSTDDFPYKKGDLLDLAVTLDINEYNGNKNVSVIIKAIKPTEIDTEKQLQSLRLFEDFCYNRVNDKTMIQSLIPDRNDFALVYRYLRSNGGYKFSIETLVFMLDNMLSFGKIKVILTAMCELGLIKITEGLNSSSIELMQVSGKVELDSADIIKKLKGVSQCG